MACKHRQTKGNTTKHYYCSIKEKAVDEYMDCSRCPLKIEDNDKVNELLKTIFGKGFDK